LTFYDTYIIVSKNYLTLINRESGLVTNGLNIHLNKKQEDSKIGKKRLKTVDI